MDKNISSNKLVQIQDVSKTYPGEKPAVGGVTLAIEKGQFFCLIGPSGCGKTTLLKMIIGLEKPTSGTITGPGRISMVFQSGALLPWLTVEENAAFGLKMEGQSKARIPQIVRQYLEMVNLTPYLKKYPRELSGGQKQRVGIARALATSPEVLLLDEPFSALDPISTEELHKDLLKIWKQAGLTIIMVSHLIEEAIMLSDQIAMMEEGTLKHVVEVNLTRPRNPYAHEFLKLAENIKGLFVPAQTQ